jgi:hypothetical protein
VANAKIIGACGGGLAARGFWQAVFCALAGFVLALV